MPTLIGVYVRDGVPQQTGLEGREVRELLVRHQIGQVVVDQGEVHAHLTHRKGFKRSHYNQHNVRRLKKRGKHMLETIHSRTSVYQTSWKVVSRHVNYIRQKTPKYAILYAEDFFNICAEICGKILLFAKKKTK